jgi:hypothetical protein
MWMPCLAHLKCLEPDLLVFTFPSEVSYTLGPTLEVVPHPAGCFQAERAEDDGKAT